MPGSRAEAKDSRLSPALEERKFGRLAAEWMGIAGRERVRHFEAEQVFPHPSHPMPYPPRRLPLRASHPPLVVAADPAQTRLSQAGPASTLAQMLSAKAGSASRLPVDRHNFALRKVDLELDILLDHATLVRRDLPSLFLVLALHDLHP